MQVQDDKPYDDINITPMLDLAYVLLIILANTAVLVALYLSRAVDAVEAEDDGRG